MFVTVDGPGGVGKTTMIGLVASGLAARGLPVYSTAQPSPTLLGEMIRAGTETYSGMALACLVAGDRHHQLESEIRPRLAGGAVVLCDRYFASSLVLQRIDGLDVGTITFLNEGIDRPDLAVILSADPALIADRLAGRGGHSRFERLPNAARIESELYADAAVRLRAAGWPVLTVESSTDSGGEAATMLTDRIADLLADRSIHDDGAGAADVQHR